MKILIAYYSRSGVTGRVAKQIQSATGGDLFEIKVQTPYPPDYSDVVQQAKQEIEAKYKPPLLNDLPDVSSYDMIFIGSPNWWSTIAPPVAAFLSGDSFSGKTVAPFITHGGGGLAGCVADIKALCPGANVGEGVDGNYASNISKWLKNLGF
jgi:flavodoxin